MVAKAIPTAEAVAVIIVAIGMSWTGPSDNAVIARRDVRTICPAENSPILQKREGIK
jgi:hypothetical protein